MPALRKASLITGNELNLYDNRQASRIRREANKMDTNLKEATWRRHIVSTPDVLSGKPRIDGTRIPVALILGYLAAEKTYEEVMAEFLI